MSIKYYIVRLRGFALFGDDGRWEAGASADIKFWSVVDNEQFRSNIQCVWWWLDV